MQLDLLELLAPVVEFAVGPDGEGNQALHEWLQGFESLAQLQQRTGDLLSESSMSRKLLKHAFEVKHDRERCRKLLSGLNILRG